MNPNPSFAENLSRFDRPETPEDRFANMELSQIEGQVTVLTERLLTPGLDSIQVQPLVNSLDALRASLTARKELLEPDAPDTQALELLTHTIDLALESYSYTAITGEQPDALDK